MKIPKYTASRGICKFMEQFMVDKVHNSQAQARKQQNKEEENELH